VVADTQNHRIQKFAADGTFITSWGRQGAYPGEFLQPYGIAGNKTGDYYAVEKYGKRVQKFTAQGEQIEEVTINDLGVPLGDLTGLTINNCGEVWVVDNTRHCLRRLNTTHGFARIIETQLGTTLSELANLYQSYREGNDIRKRLEQLHLSLSAFLRLHEILEMVSAETELTEQEQTEVINILVQTRKSRKYADWNEEETDLGLTLSQDHFAVAEFEIPEDKKWRIKREERWNWAYRVRTRIEQEQNTYAALWDGVDQAEEESIALLRNQLIETAQSQNTSITVEELSQQLLVDLEIAPCQKTTRISVAINALQKLFFLLQTGQNVETVFENLTLNNLNNGFAAQWEWLGSYERWRAAVGVFLYPENLLLPTLRRKQTPTFQRIAQTLRNVGMITPEKARQFGKEYEEYFKDICNLDQLVSTVGSTKFTVLDANGNWNTEYRDLLYNFAIAKDNRKVYWSFYDESPGTEFVGYENSFWEPVPGLENYSVEKIIGAPVNDLLRADDSKYLILLFIIRDKFGDPKLNLFKFDLNKSEWAEEPIELSTPVSLSFNSILSQPLSRKDLPELIIKPGINVNERNVYARTLNFELNDWTANKGDEWNASYIIIPEDFQENGMLAFSIENTNSRFLLLYTYSPQGGEV